MLPIIGDRDLGPDHQKNEAAQETYTEAAQDEAPDKSEEIYPAHDMKAMLQQFFYKVQAVANSGQLSDLSGFVGAIADDDQVAPAAPRNIAAVPDPVNFGRVVVTWSPVLQEIDGTRLTRLQGYRIPIPPSSRWRRSPVISPNSLIVASTCQPRISTR